MLEARRPWLRRARPHLQPGLEPRCVVQRSGLDQCQLGGDRRDAEYRRSAGRTEAPLRVGPVVLAGRGVGGERAPLDREGRERYAHDHRERAARLALAVGAVADRLNDGLGLGAVLTLPHRQRPVMCSGGPLIQRATLHQAGSPRHEHPRNRRLSPAGSAHTMQPRPCPTPNARRPASRSAPVSPRTVSWRCSHGAWRCWARWSQASWPSARSAWP